ncbi:MAG: hypothetical protein V4534_07880 [Myxococcota bacterium]
MIKNLLFIVCFLSFTADLNAQQNPMSESDKKQDRDVRISPNVRLMLISVTGGLAIYFCVNPLQPHMPEHVALDRFIRTMFGLSAATFIAIAAVQFILQND